MPSSSSGVLGKIKRFFRHKEINFTITSIFIILTLYISFCAVLQKDLQDPLDPDVSPLLGIFNETHLNALDVSKTSIPITVTVMALFLLWVLAMVFGQIMSWLRLPALLGMLLAGILVRNVDFFASFRQIGAEWDNILRALAFLLILIRCGVNLEPEALRNSLAVFLSLGFISTIVEAVAVVLASYFLFDINLPLAILFSFVLTSTSPAVTVPSMIRLQDKGRGTNKGIPTTILAAASIDNIFCITAFSIAASALFSGNQDITNLAIRIPVELIVAILGGILLGLFLCIFPRPDAHHAHFIRSVIISTFSTAIFFATKSIGSAMIGPISVFIMVVVASLKWERDNLKKTRREEKCFKIVWDDVLQPFLFALIGLVFDFSQITWSIFLNAMAIIFIGLAIRILTVFIMSLFMTSFSLKEKLFLSICFSPKATVQAALAPLLVQYANGSNDPDKVNFLFNTCVLSILITAPIGQLLIDCLGKVLLKKEPREIDVDEESEASVLPQISEPKLNGDFDRQPSFIKAGKDNTLRVKVIPEENLDNFTPIPRYSESSI